MFQLGIFLRALRPARTGLRPARFTSALPELLTKNQPPRLTKCNCCCVFKQLMYKCLCLQICAHVFIDRLQNCAQTSFACWIVTEFWSFTRKSVPHLVIRVLNCARFCVVCALNCARFFVVRALDCAQFLLHPALFPT